MKNSLAIQFSVPENYASNAENSEGFFLQLSKTIKIWSRRHTTRQHLARASFHILEDVDLTETQRLIEVEKSFWEQ